MAPCSVVILWPGRFQVNPLPEKPASRVLWRDGLPIYPSAIGSISAPLEEVGGIIIISPPPTPRGSILQGVPLALGSLLLLAQVSRRSMGGPTKMFHIEALQLLRLALPFEVTSGWKMKVCQVHSSVVVGQWEDSYLVLMYYMEQLSTKFSTFGSRHLDTSSQSQC